MLAMPLAACASDDGSTRGTTTAVPKEQGEDQADSGSPLSRRDIPPEAVHEQLSFSAGGNGPCPDPLPDPPSGPYLDVEGYVTETPQLGWPLHICGYQFPVGEVRIEVREPSGDIVHSATKSVEPSSGVMEYLLDGLDPRIGVGNYAVHLSQGDLTATEVVQYEPALSHRIVRRYDELADQNEVRSGSPVTFDLVGYPPGNSVELALYVDVGPESHFATMLSPVAIGQDGVGTLTISTDAGDSGCYAVLPDPQGARERSFVFADPGSNAGVDASFQDMFFCVISK